MKTVARLIVIASMVLAGLSLSACGVALAAPGQDLAGSPYGLAVPEFSGTRPVVVSESATFRREAAESPEPPVVSGSRIATNADESSEGNKPAEATESPVTTESHDVKSNRSYGQHDHGESNTGGGTAGGQGGRGGDASQPARAGWAAVVSKTGQDRGFQLSLVGL